MRTYAGHVFSGSWAGRWRVVGEVDIMGECSRHGSSSYMASWWSQDGRLFWPVGRYLAT